MLCITVMVRLWIFFRNTVLSKRIKKVINDKIIISCYGSVMYTTFDRVEKKKMLLIKPNMKL